MSNNELYEYSPINKDNCSIKRILDDSITILELPSISPDGKAVTAIEQKAFKGNTAITEVVISDSIKVIGNSCFEDCSNLRKVTFPKKMDKIGIKAFKRCDLESIVIPKTSLVNYAAFSFNENATVRLYQPIGCVKSHAFSMCAKIVCSLHKDTQKHWDTDWAGETESIEFVDKSEIPTGDSAEDTVVDIATATDESKTIISSSQEDNLKAGIYYTRSKKLSFSVKGLMFTDIPVLQSVQLSFYEKYTVLLLQKGIRATDEAGLIDCISSWLNVSKKCIAEFIDYLTVKKYLTFDYRKRMYKLDSSIHFILDKNRDNAMFADLEVKNADCNKIVFVDNLNAFYLEEDFLKTVFTRKEKQNSNTGSYLPTYVSNLVYANKERLNLLFEESFKKTNMHLKKDFSYNLREDSFFDYQFEFDALIEYKYFKDQKKAVRQSVIIQKSNPLPEAFINQLVEPYDTDDKIPRFIELDEEFYQKISPKTNELTQIEKTIDAVKDSVEPIQKEIVADKNKLIALKKDHTKAKKVEADKGTKIQKEIKEKEQEIRINEELIQSSDDSAGDTELIKNLKKTIKELKSEKSELEVKLKDNQKAIDDLTETFSKIEEELNATIRGKEEEIRQRNESIKEYEQQKRTSVSDYKLLLSKNDKVLNPIIKAVVSKYPAYDNLLYRDIASICLGLDSAISASECVSFDEMVRSIDGIRETYRKVLQVIFEVTLKKSAKSLGDYLSDPYNSIAIDGMFKNRGVAAGIKSRLIVFHNLANAFGHSTENGPQKRANDQRVFDFKQLDTDKRTKILLAIPELFSAITFTKTEVASIVSKLKV